MKRTLVIALLVLAPVAAFGQTVLDFELGLCSGCAIGSSYSGKGITFNPNTQAVVIGPSSWALYGTNGPAFLAFNGGNPGYTMTMTFSSPKTSVSMDVSRSAGSADGDTFTATAYNGATAVGTSTITFGPVNTWTTVTLTAANITSVTWAGAGAGFHPYGVDNIKLTSATDLTPGQAPVTCNFNTGSAGDAIDRAFYVPNFPASTLGRVQLRFSSSVSGDHVLALTARDSTFDGTLIGTAIASVLLSGTVGSPSDPVVSFNFYGAAVTAGHTVTFAVTPIRIPSNAFVYFDYGYPGGCSAPVYETDSTTPPLSTQRRANMGVTIYAPQVAHTGRWVPVVSHGPGAAGSQWRSDVSLVNRSSSAADVALCLHEGSNPIRTLLVPAGATAGAGGEQTIGDVVAWIDPTFSGSAALEVLSDQPITVESRNYNLVPPDATCTPSGTFGQLYDAFTPENMLIAGQTGFLVGLAENASFRTNIGLTNIGAIPAQVTVSLCDNTGAVLATYDVSLAPGQWLQAYRPFNGYAHRTDLNACYAKVAVTAGNGVIAYGSVVDWLTNDATTVMAKP
jgi:hypothetical protein